MNKEIIKTIMDIRKFLENMNNLFNIIKNK